MAYSGYLEPVELRWVAANAGQGSILEAVIHGGSVRLDDVMSHTKRWMSQNPLFKRIGKYVESRLF